MWQIEMRSMSVQGLAWNRSEFESPAHLATACGASINTLLTCVSCPYDTIHYYLLSNTKTQMLETVTLLKSPLFCTFTRIPDSP